MNALRPLSYKILACPKLLSRNATSVLSPLEQKYFPHIGNREIVGFGINGTPMYLDDVARPYPSIRFQNHTDKVPISLLTDICRSKLFVKRKKDHGRNYLWMK